MIQFLKGSLSAEVSEGLKCLEPDMKVFRFEKQGDYFEKLSEEQKKEEKKQKPKSSWASRSRSARTSRR